MLFNRSDNQEPGKYIRKESLAHGLNRVEANHLGAHSLLVQFVGGADGHHEGVARAEQTNILTWTNDNRLADDEVHGLFMDDWLALLAYADIDRLVIRQ